MPVSKWAPRVVNATTRAPACPQSHCNPENPLCPPSVSTIFKISVIFFTNLYSFYVHTYSFLKIASILISSHHWSTIPHQNLLYQLWFLFLVELLSNLMLPYLLITLSVWSILAILSVSLFNIASVNNNRKLSFVIFYWYCK
mgnify:FL=1